MTSRQRFLFFLTAWLIVLMPFLFWWNTWFGRQLSPKQLSEYLNDNQHPRHIQHALVQTGERMARNDSQVRRLYPDLVRLASHPVEEVRNTDAWVMGQDTAGPGFHQALLELLRDPSPMVRGNAALSLVRYGDPAGRPQIVALLQPAQVNAPASGRVMDSALSGTSVHQGGLIAKLENNGQEVEVRSPIAGRIRALSAQRGQNVAAGATLATIDPGTGQLWEALRALYLVGTPDDLPAIAPYARDLPENAGRIREQATLTIKAIQDRSPR